VRRILIGHYRPEPRPNGEPSWLAAIGHTTDRLWSVDLFRVESILLKSYWVMVVMDIFTRRIIGFAIAAADIDLRDREASYAPAPFLRPRSFVSDSGRSVSRNSPHTGQFAQSEPRF
jgi:transposase InsO family protein